MIVWMRPRIVGYAVAECPGSMFPPNIEDVHPTRESAEGEAAAMADMHEREYRIYEIREVQP